LFKDYADSGREVLPVERELGFHHTNHNLFADEELGLGLVSIISFDWPHNMFVNGIFVRECDALMILLERHNLGVSTLAGYLRFWRWPGGYAGAAQICDTGRVNGSMSEYLSLYPVLIEFLHKVVPAGICDGPVESMRLLCKLVALFQRTVKPGAVSGRELEAAMLAHSRKQQEVYHNELWIPKSHYNLHTIDLLEYWKFLLSSLPCERKHKEVKAAAHDRDSKITYERGVMEEITMAHIQRFIAIGVSTMEEAQLLHATSPSNQLRNILTTDFGVLRDVSASRVAYVHAREMRSGDVVLYRVGDAISAGNLWLHANINGVVWSCVAPWEFLSRERDAARFIVKTKPAWVTTTSLVETTIWSHASAGEISNVLIPSHVDLVVC